MLPEERLQKLSEEELQRVMSAPCIINPRTAHLNALTFFNLMVKGDALVCEGGSIFNPKIGLYLVGKPGSGKTHVMAAAGLIAHRELQKQLAGLEAQIEDLLRRELGAHAESLKHWKSETVVPQLRIEGDIQKGEAVTKKEISIEQRFAKLLDKIRDVLRKSPLQPTDVLYVGFDELYRYTSDDLSIRQEMLDGIAAARLVFIDDMHPKGDPDRFTLAHHIIERRYESGKHGTFITTNLNASALGNKEHENSSQLTARLTSRCNECFWTITFKDDCLDWREVLRSRRVKQIEAAITANTTKLIAEEKREHAEV